MEKWTSTTIQEPERTGSADDLDDLIFQGESWLVSDL